MLYNAGQAQRNRSATRHGKISVRLPCRTKTFSCVKTDVRDTCDDDVIADLLINIERILAKLDKHSDPHVKELAEELFTLPIGASREVKTLAYALFQKAMSEPVTGPRMVEIVSALSERLPQLVDIFVCLIQCAYTALGPRFEAIETWEVDFMTEEEHEERLEARDAMATLQRLCADLVVCRRRRAEETANGLLAWVVFRRLIFQFLGKLGYPFTPPSLRVEVVLDVLSTHGKRLDDARADYMSHFLERLLEIHNFPGYSTALKQSIDDLMECRAMGWQWQTLRIIKLLQRPQEDGQDQIHGFDLRGEQVGQVHGNTSHINPAWLYWEFARMCKTQPSRIRLVSPDGYLFGQ
eukprot:TRINITY_DN82530_c0_g1_i1.p1 TRINITY_DN82530_c0_g1~~TRINITY_DN82530_c0_g1_i1.p1  ORF type:complete len:352 (-),score=27.81 TRINITY_DN82530_c0_g1_i1:92-1147(-)